MVTPSSDSSGINSLPSEYSSALQKMEEAQVRGRYYFCLKNGRLTITAQKTQALSLESLKQHDHELLEKGVLKASDKQIFEKIYKFQANALFITKKTVERPKKQNRVSLTSIAERYGPKQSLLFPVKIEQSFSDSLDKEKIGNMHIKPSQKAQVVRKEESLFLKALKHNLEEVLKYIEEPLLGAFYGKSNEWENLRKLKIEFLQKTNDTVENDHINFLIHEDFKEIYSQFKPYFLEGIIDFAKKSNFTRLDQIVANWDSIVRSLANNDIAEIRNKVGLVDDPYVHELLDEILDLFPEVILENRNNNELITSNLKNLPRLNYEERKAYLKKSVSEYEVLATFINGRIYCLSHKEQLDSLYLNYLLVSGFTHSEQNRNGFDELIQAWVANLFTQYKSVLKNAHTKSGLIDYLNTLGYKNKLVVDTYHRAIHALDLQNNFNSALSTFLYDLLVGCVSNAATCQAITQWTQSLTFVDSTLINSMEKSLNKSSDTIEKELVSVFRSSKLSTEEKTEKTTQKLQEMMHFLVKDFVGSLRLNGTSLSPFYSLERIHEELISVSEDASYGIEEVVGDSKFVKATKEFISKLFREASASCAVAFFQKYPG